MKTTSERKQLTPLCSSAAFHDSPLKSSSISPSAPCKGAIKLLDSKHLANGTVKTINPDWRALVIKGRHWPEITVRRLHAPRQIEEECLSEGMYGLIYAAQDFKDGSGGWRNYALYRIKWRIYAVFKLWSQRFDVYNEDPCLTDASEPSIVAAPQVEPYVDLPEYINPGIPARYWEVIQCLAEGGSAWEVAKSSGYSERQVVRIRTKFRKQFAINHVKK